MFQETDCKFQEMDRRFQETSKEMRALQDLFKAQWGKRKDSRDGEIYELDIIAQLGAVAYLHAEQASDRHAQNKGLFVIRATGDSASIVHLMDFQPRQFR